MNKRSETIVAIAHFLRDIAEHEPGGFRFLRNSDGKILSYQSNDIDRMLALINSYMDDGMSFCPVAFDARKMTPEHQLPSRWLWTREGSGDITKAWTSPNFSIKAQNDYWSMWNTGSWETRTNAMNEAIAKQIGGHVETFVPLPFTGGAKFVRHSKPWAVDPPVLPAASRPRTTTEKALAPVEALSRQPTQSATKTVAQLLKRYGDAKSKKGIALHKYFAAGHDTSARYALAMTLGEAGATREDIIALVSASGGDRADAERLAAKACVK